MKVSQYRTIAVAAGAVGIAIEHNPYLVIGPVLLLAALLDIVLFDLPYLNRARKDADKIISLCERLIQLDIPDDNTRFITELVHEEMTGERRFHTSLFVANGIIVLVCSVLAAIVDFYVDSFSLNLMTAIALYYITIINLEDLSFRLGIRKLLRYRH